MSKKSWKLTRDVALLLTAIIAPMAAATQLFGAVGVYIPILLAILTGVVWQAERRLPEDKRIFGPRVPVAVLVVVSLSLVGCPQPYRAAWNTTYQVREVGQLAERLIAKKASMEHEKCLAAYGAKTDAYAECIQPYYEGLQTWKKVIEPALNAALIGTVAAIQIAERAGDKTIDWRRELLPGVCALIQMATQYEILLGEKAKDILQYLKAGETWVCEVLK